eukprot:gnl/MRDRNA2_/MRDRNA2_121442_c0_seq1.p1 gnl/MRDRNA2_/MRDRNA2_121442_c0~~gnl/MRDRNA2_/MRDRNA2_121442_c0_seq1.p1  ORF type:complete len:1077 (-),score=162.84 gnl/MRDRNA2_/MRDRNA2_121442_c0_seq1:201-3431(-)
MLPTSMKVAVRIRPVQAHDGKVTSTCVTKVDQTSVQVMSAGSSPAIKGYDFDQVFGQDASQHDVYTSCAKPLVEAVLGGRNACIFAFGCTGCGKTYSMLGPEGGSKRSSQDGVLPRAAADLFRQIARLEMDTAQAIGAGGFSAYEVRASFIEVYCENAFDLLGGPVSASREPSAACNLREDRDGRVYAEGAQEVRVTSVSHLLDVVAQGAAARSTAATGVHAHSSRSHALLVLSVEHRWREVGEQDPRRFKSQVVRFTLVDLAGAESMERAHGGDFNAAGVGTNMGLLVLGRVIRALAEGGKGVVPYRDSTLTRLMQSCLSGNALTQMLACISPVPQEADGAMHTLGYALSARSVKLSAQIAPVLEESDQDPMIGDFDDEDSELQRRAIWIETSFGDVFARCVGDPADPLILYVHGSGPKNSSMNWNNLVLDVVQLAKASAKAPQKFFHVAIDCPGYGRSPGDRQVIRSYPGRFLSSIVQALGRRSAVSLVGSSQGACAVFNCALECPDLAHTLAVCHPVGHAPQRYTAISQPSLLIFNTEDAGHPVSVGRQMRRYLQNPIYYEFTHSKDGNWECVHMGEELYAMLERNWPVIKKKRLGGSRDKKLPELTRVAGGYKSWTEAHNGEWLPWCGVGDDFEDGITAAQDCAADDGSVWRAVLDPSSNVMLYEHVQSGRRAKLRPPGARVIVERMGAKEGRSAPSKAVCEPLFEGTAADAESEDEEERQAREAQASIEKLEAEAAQTECDLCGRFLIDAVRLTRCRCALCACCVERTLRYTRQCPVCSETVSFTGAGTVASDAKELQKRLSSHLSCPDYDAQRRYLTHLQLARTRVSRIVLEYGNVSRSDGSKTSFTTFLRVASTEGSLASKNAVARVDFNINPSYSKPTATTKDPNDKRLGFAFEYSMARTYPCVMTVHFLSSLNIPKLQINYEVVEAPKVARRIIVEVPAERETNSRAGIVVFEAGAQEDVLPRNGWIRCPCFRGEDCTVQYLPEGLDKSELHAYYAPSLADQGVRLPRRSSSRASSRGSARGSDQNGRISPQHRKGRSTSSTRSPSSAGSVHSVDAQPRQRGIDRVM